MEVTVPCKEHNQVDGSSDNVNSEDCPWNDCEDDASTHAIALTREWKWRQNQFHTIGYRDGIASGKEASAQEGFNIGFKQSAHLGYTWGCVKGVSRVLASLPCCSLEKLVKTPQNREKILNLCKYLRTISTKDMLEMFHDSTSLSRSMQSHGDSQGDLKLKAMKIDNLKPTREDQVCNKIEMLSKDLITLLHDCPELEVNINFSKMGGETSG